MNGATSNTSASFLSFANEGDGRPDGWRDVKYFSQLSLLCRTRVAEGETLDGAERNISLRILSFIDQGFKVEEDDGNERDTMAIRNTGC